MLCRIFRPIDWYHSLVPKTFFSGVIQDLGPFLESSFCPITRKRLFFSAYFRFWGPIIFQFPVRWPIHYFGGLNFFENFSYYWNSFSHSPLSLTQSEEIYIFLKTVKCRDDAFIRQSPNFRAKMADAGWLEEEEDDMAEKCWGAM